MPTFALRPDELHDPLDFLHPPIEPSSAGLLDVGDGHRIWWETSGSDDGVPVLFLHGGPGAPPKAASRRAFDPAFYRLVVLHQRGCGRSTPLAETHANSTPHLIADLEALRTHLGIDRWLITGGSWGSCLAIAYGETHPERCLGFRLRGVFLARDSEVDWWWNGTRMIYPDAYDELIAILTPGERANPRAAFHARLMDDRPAIHIAAAQAFARFSGSTVHLHHNARKVSEAMEPPSALPLARLFLHYLHHRFFLRPNQLLDDLHRIAHLPCRIVSGRFDVTTPVETAWTLHKAWPGSTIDVLPDGSHDELDPAVARALLAAHENLKQHVR